MLSKNSKKNDYRPFLAFYVFKGTCRLAWKQSVIFIQRTHCGL